MIFLFIKRLKHHSQWLADLEKKELDKDALDLLVNKHHLIDIFFFFCSFNFIYSNSYPYNEGIYLSFLIYIIEKRSFIYCRQRQTHATCDCH